MLTDWERKRLILVNVNGTRPCWDLIRNILQRMEWMVCFILGERVYALLMVKTPVLIATIT